MSLILKTDNLLRRQYFTKLTSCLCLALIVIASAGLILLNHKAYALSANDFVTTWKTDNPGTTDSSSITLPMSGTNYSVDWNNDGTFDQTGLSGTVTHDFGTPGTYTIRISGDFGATQFSGSADPEKLISIDQWGTGAWSTMQSAFYGCTNLTSNATDTPNLTDVSSMAGAFSQSSFNGDISHWDVSHVTTVAGMFRNDTDFNSDLSDWNVSNVTTMESMFYGATSFNQDLSSWDVSHVTDMLNMFEGATSFDGSLSGWNVANVTTMSLMFAGATSFNQDLSSWDVSHVTDMSYLFYGASTFNGDISTWNTGSVGFTSWMFGSAYSFNQDLSHWDVGHVTDMSNMFSGAHSFSSDISHWDVSSVTTMHAMFASATSFNQDLSSWDVSNVTDMSNMFESASTFNGDISTWNTISVTSMYDMFHLAGVFNDDLSSWDVSNVTTMYAMFAGAAYFNSDISHWDVSHVTSMDTMFSNSGLSVSNYSKLLVGWSSLTLQDSVNFSAGTAGYCVAGAARQEIINTYHWIINDGGQGCGVYINGSSSINIITGNTPGAEVGILSPFGGLVPRTTNPYSLGCTTAGLDDSLFTVSGDKLYAISSLDVDHPQDSDADNSYQVCVRTIDTMGRAVDSTLNMVVSKEKKITSVQFNQSEGKETLVVNGSVLLDESSGEYADALTRSLVKLNGVDLPFCADGTGMNADDWISTYGGYGYDLNGLVSDAAPCYYLVDEAVQPLINGSHATINLPDGFDITAEGTVSVNGSSAYMFNGTQTTIPPSDGGNSPTAGGQTNNSGTNANTASNPPKNNSNFHVPCTDATPLCGSFVSDLSKDIDSKANSDANNTPHNASTASPKDTMGNKNQGSENNKQSNTMWGWIASGAAIVVVVTGGLIILFKRSLVQR